MRKRRIFLGGTCAESKWRETLIEKLDSDSLSWFNPVVKDWNEEAQKREIEERGKCDFCLYTITPLMMGVYSIAEVVDDAHRRPKKTVFCVVESDVDENDDTKLFTKAQLKSLDQVGKMVEELGAKYFTTLEDTAKYLNKESTKLKRVK